SAGGSVSIEQLDGLPGNLVSPHDPIILANGDVSLGNYTGASLHILAGGSVTVGDIEINSTDTADNAISPDNSNPFLASLANVTLSDEARTSVVIDGSNQPTLDIRAGIDWTLLAGFPGNTDSGNLGSNFGTGATSADIEIGDISINAPNGLVLLTNQYQANPSLVSETLKISSLLTGDGTIAKVVNKKLMNDTSNQRFSGNGGEVLIDYRGPIEISGRIDASSASGKAGDITVVTNDQLSLDNSFIISNTFGTEKGGDITIDTGSLSAKNGAQIETSTFFVIKEDDNIDTSIFENADAGKVTIIADDTVTFEGKSQDGQTSGIVNNILNDIDRKAEPKPIVDSGGIFITTGSLVVNDGAQLEARVGEEDTAGTGNVRKSWGNSGDINIVARDTVSFDGGGFENDGGAFTSVEGQGNGTAGDINIQARSVSVSNDASLQSNLIGQGNGGNLKIVASDSIILDGAQNSILTRVNRSGKATDDNNGGGNVDIETRSLYLTNGARIVASTFGKGNAGNVKITVAEDIVFDGNLVNQFNQTIASGVLSQVAEGARGNGGKIEIIEANSIAITNTAKVDSSTAGAGDAGPIIISTNQLTLRDGGEISAATFGPGNAGNISVKEADSVVLTNDSNILSEVEPTSSGNGGQIEISTDSLSLTNGSTIANRTQGFNPVRLVQQVLANPDTTYNEAVLGDNPIVYWSLDETSGSTAFNATGNGFNGTYEGGVTQGVPGISGTAGQFNGKNDTAVDIGTVPSGSDLDISNQSFTVEAWIKPNEIGERQAYFGIHKRIKSDNDKSESLYFRLNENASVAFGDFPNDLETPENIIEVDTWYHVVASYDKDSDTNTIFVNGREINRNNQGFFNGEEPRILIGTWPNIGDQSFNGVIDEVAVYNTALSPETVAQHYLIGQRSLGAPIEIGDSGANAGTINVHANSITISGVSPTNNTISSGLLSDSSGDFSGVAGTITIDTDSLKVEDGGIITVKSEKGIAGNLDITANSLLLNNGRLLAETQLSGGEDGANITLDVSESIVMLNESLISAEASEEATGGNIDIDTDVLIAFPPTGPDGSDIIAKAARGQGGEITIEAEDVRLIEEREAIEENRTNDIDASSESGPQGIVTINTGNIDPSRGLDQLPINLTDPSSLIVASCPRSGKVSVDELGEFIVTGRGGIPASPFDPIIGQAIIADWVTLEDQTLSEIDHNLDKNQTLAPSTEHNSIPQNSKPKRIVEAQGWMIGPDGTIILTSFPTDTTSPPKPWYHYFSCRDLN
ncbi:LamG-like jellyroll fold domain-containing protein, partial [Moorena sp. SIO2C4]|uniref:LamG-like jellyroll fold domain-containing protein n=1 Tax=Moorena sp. SIO2C4 TaxID=2607824 RepID=UPI0013CCC69B|nr:hypothetical protein [Moorena sp. SIO2C4]